MRYTPPAPTVEGEIARARARYVNGSIELEEFEEIVHGALRGDIPKPLYLALRPKVRGGFLGPEGP